MKIGRKRNFFIGGVLLFILGAVGGNPALAQQESAANFPSRPVTFIVHYGAGGTTDLSARKLASFAEKEFNQSVNVENKLGGSGVAAYNALAKSKPDGYTIGTFSYGASVLIPHQRSVPFNPKEDFSFILQYAEYPQPLCIRKDAPWNTLKELVEYARQNPGAVTYSTAGPGASSHLFMEMLAKREKLKLVHVPFRGGADGVAAILGGHVVASLAAEVAPQLKAGTVRALAVLGEKRLKSLPDVPTFLELGYPIRVPLWLGIAAPKNVPSPILNKLEGTFTRGFQDPSFGEALDKLIMTPVFRKSDEFRKFILEEYDRGRELVESAGMLKKENP